MFSLDENIYKPYLCLILIPSYPGGYVCVTFALLPWYNPNEGGLMPLQGLVYGPIGIPCAPVREGLTDLWPTFWSNHQQEQYLCRLLILVNFIE